MQYVCRWNGRPIPPFQAARTLDATATVACQRTCHEVHTRLELRSREVGSLEVAHSRLGRIGRRRGAAAVANCKSFPSLDLDPPSPDFGLAEPTGCRIQMVPNYQHTASVVSYFWSRLSLWEPQTSFCGEACPEACPCLDGYENLSSQMRHLFYVRHHDRTMIAPQLSTPHSLP